MQPSTEPVSPRRARRRTVVVGVVLVLAALLIVAGWRFRENTDPERLRTTVQSTLQPLFHGRVTVGGARFELPGRVVVSDIRVDAGAPLPDRVGTDRSGVAPRENRPGAADSVFCPHLELDFHFVDLLLGRTDPATMSVRNPDIRLRSDPVTGRNAIDALLRTPGVEGRTVAVTVPRIEIEDARIRLIGAETAPPVEFRLTVRARPTPSDPKTVDFTWSLNPESLSGRLQWDARAGRLRSMEGALPPIPIDTIVSLCGAAGAPLRRQLEQLRARGDLRLRTFDIGLHPSPHVDSVEIELADASAVIPVHDVPTPDAGRVPHDGTDEESSGDSGVVMEDLGGRLESEEFVTLNEAHAQVTYREGRLRITSWAQLRGADVTAEGEFTLDNAFAEAFRGSEGSVHVDIRRLRLPRMDAGDGERRVIEASRLLRTIYHDYDPHGFVDLDLNLRKRRDGDWKLERGRVTAIDGDASFRLRPYRGVRVRGTIDFDPSEVVIRELAGEHDGGIVVINGRVRGTDRCAPCDVTVRGTGLPIDEALLGALPPEFQDAVRDFHPTGRVDVALSAQRTSCEGDRPGRWTSQTSVALDGVSVRHRQYPLPVSDIRGSLMVADGRVGLDSVAGRHGDGAVRADGTIDFASSRVSALEVLIQGSGLSLDHELVSALPAAVRDGLETLQLTGALDTRTRVFMEPATGLIRHECEIDLHDAAMSHPRIPLPLTGITGRVRLFDDRVETEDLVLHHRESELRASGWSALDGSSGSWHVVSAALTLDEDWVRALPSAWRQPLSDWRIESPIALDLHADRDPSDADSKWSLRASAMLNGAVVRRSGLSQPFEGVRGTVRIDDQGIRANKIEARLDAARVRASLEAGPTESGARGLVSLTAEGVRLGTWIRELLPTKLQSAWNAADPSGHVDLRVDRLDFVTSSPGQHGTWSVDGRLDLHEVNLRGSPAVENVSGRVSGFGFLVDRLGGCALNGDLTLHSLDILNRQFTGLQAAWSLLQSKDGATSLGLDRIQGQVYGGRVTGQVEAVADDDGTRYSVSATAQDVEINPWLNAGRRASHMDPVPSDIRGEANAQLYFSGRVGETDSERGGGMVEVHDARLYKLPILLAILSVLNVSMPEQQAFEEAQASFYVVGNRMQFNDIALRGPSVALLGNGVLTLPDQGLDLDLFSVNPRSWARLPGISDIFEGTTRQLVGIEVTGSMRNPVVRVKPLQGLTEEFRRLFQQRKPVPLLPAAG